MRAAIVGMGEFRPPNVRTNDAWPADFAARVAASIRTELTDIEAGTSADLCDRVVARHLESEHGDVFLGARRRLVFDASMTACDAEAIAARGALAEANMPAADVDVVLSWAAVPDRPTPPSAPRVAHLIGAKRAIAMGLDVGCATIMGQLLFAASLVESGRARNVLLTSSHFITRAFPLEHPASPSVGDIANAVIVAPAERPGILAVAGVTHGEYYDAVTWRRGKDDDTPWWEPGGAMYLGSYDREAVRRIVRDTVRFGADTVREAAARAGIGLGDIDVLCSVQPRRWIPSAICEALGLSPEIAPQTFDELAHLGGCGVVTNLIEARRRGMLAPRAGRDGCAPRAPVVCLYAQGAGFTRAAAIVRWGA
jgi:3-oxoacyl-[acyl-carrier-protein] synthase III